MFDSIISCVEIVGERRKLSSDGVDLLDERREACFKTKPTNSEFSGPDAIGQLTIREATLFCLSKEILEILQVLCHIQHEN